MSGKLYLVGTPIGNLGDISPRALDTLRSVDFIACEDTRVSRGLLTHFDIHKSLVSYHEHNSRSGGEVILNRLLAGETAALITDAGMPTISDPGCDLVELCAGSGVEVVVIPGPSAVVSALSMSPFGGGRFCFEGFLSVTQKSRREHLESLREESRTMVFYEAPHKLLRTLNDMLACFGNRRLTICREMTKLHEESLNLTLEQAAEHFTQTPPRGEFVLVIEGAQKKDAPSPEQAIKLAREYLDGGMSVRDAAKKAAAETGVSRREIYGALTDE